MTMQVLLVIQGAYKKMVSEKVEKMKTSAPARRRR